MDADLYTTQVDFNKTFPEFMNYDVYKHKLYTYPTNYQLEAIMVFRKMELNKDYDVIITSGNWAKQVAMKKKYGNLQTPIISYIHTPIRMCYIDYWMRKRKLGFFKRQLFKIWSWYISYLDQQSMPHIDKLLTNSANTNTRIQRIYGRTAEVVYPPVPIDNFYHEESEEYFLSVQRIEPEKRIELQLEAFKKIDAKLKIVGGINEEYMKKLRKIKPDNVEFLGRVPDHKLYELYSKCKAVIQTNIDEDFGIVPVEAMACGKPCIAVNEGGFKESITDKTGVLINPPYAKNLRKVIQDFDYDKFDKRDCQERAKLFSEEKFIEKIKDKLKEV